MNIRSTTHPSKLRVLYAAGPGDVIGTYRQWAAGVEDTTQVARTYSGQFYELCEDLDAFGVVVATHPEAKTFAEGRFIIEHRPLRFKNAGGLTYHLGQLLYGLGLIRTAVRHRCHATVVSTGTHWFVLRLLPLLGIRVIPTLHCVLWPKHARISRIQRLTLRLGAGLFSRSADRILSASHDITAQVQELTGGRHRPVIHFLPTYLPQMFDPIAPPQPRQPGQVMSVLYAGRIEEDKGVFDLLECARRLKDEMPGQLRFDVCGTGSAIERLQQKRDELGLTDIFILHGHCDRKQMEQRFSAAHVVVVPTTSDFVEGFNQVVVEAILAGRPCITSLVCPSLRYVKDAIVEVPPDDVDAYTDAIHRMASDNELYLSRQHATTQYQSQFYDPQTGWGYALRTALMQNPPAADHLDNGPVSTHNA